MITRDCLIKIGRYNKPHGVHGEISATVDIDIDKLSKFSCLVSDIDGIYVPFFVGASRPKSSQTVLLTIDGVCSDKDAELLVNEDIYVLQKEYQAVASEMEDDEQYPLDFFIGFTVQDVQGETVGTITEVDDSTMNVLFLVQRENGETVRIPAVDELITDLNLTDKKMIMDLPKGILTL